MRCLYPARDPRGSGRFRCGRRLLYAEDLPDDGREVVAWVTSEPMTDAGLAWIALSEAHPRTGLVPVLLPRDGSDGTGLSGWDFGFVGTPQVPLVDSVSAQGVLLAPSSLNLPSLPRRRRRGCLKPRCARPRSARGPAFLRAGRREAYRGHPGCCRLERLRRRRPWGPQARSPGIAAVLRSLGRPVRRAPAPYRRRLRSSSWSSAYAQDAGVHQGCRRALRVRQRVHRRGLHRPRPRGTSGRRASLALLVGLIVNAVRTVRTQRVMFRKAQPATTHPRGDQVSRIRSG